MLKIFILDDEKKAIDNLLYLLENNFEERFIIESSHAPLEAVQRIHDFNPDLLFLDVQMPHLDGFAFLKALGEINFEVIFITAYEQYAIEAIKVSALDYLVKPIDTDDLKESLLRYNKKRSHPAELLNEPSISNGRLAIHQIDGVHFIVLGNIIRMESDGNYTKIYSEKENYLISSKTLKTYEELLSHQGFIRIHNSHMVNMEKIKSILKNEILILIDGTQLPISRRRKKDLREAIGLE